jgi:hypothetical protein
VDDAELARLLESKFGYRIGAEESDPLLREGVRHVKWLGRGSHSRGDSLRSDGRLVFIRSVDEIRPFLVPLRDRTSIFEYFWLLYRRYWRPILW